MKDFYNKMSSTEKSATGVILLLIIVLFFVSCNRATPVVAQPVAAAPMMAPAQAPVVVHSSNDGLLTGMLIGHAMSSNNNQPVATPVAPAAPKVEAKPVTQPTPAPVVKPSIYSAPVTTASKPNIYAAPKPSSYSAPVRSYSYSSGGRR